MKRLALIESGVSDPRKFVYQVYPPHGLMYLSSWLRREKPELEIKIIDLMVRRAAEESVLAELEEFSPELVGIHAMHFQARSMHRLAALVKSRLQIPVVVGGPYPSSEPEAALSDPNIDLAVLGEGEVTFAELVSRLESGRDWHGLAGGAFRQDGKVVRGPERELIAELDQVPFPAWDLIELEKFFDLKLLTQNDLRVHKELATIFTSRACPYGCIFCHNMFGKKFRARSPENVLDEIKLLYERYGVRELHVIDDCFNFDMERAKKILGLLIDSGMKLKLAFPNGVRGDRLDRELVGLLKAAGTYKLNFGIESGSERIQKMIRKGLNLDRIRESIALADEAGIFTHGFFMMGFPGETEDELEATIRFACQSRLHSAGFALLSPFPGTRVRELAESMGKPCTFDPEDTSYAAMACNLTEVSDRKLAYYHRRGHWRFYFRPRQIWRIWKAVPNKRMLPRIIASHFRLKFL
jgi:radical SAM superfamily enzyme YgiQ (UPF0313 family)